MYEVNKLRSLQIGVQGENESIRIEIDMTAWAEELSESTVYGILFKPYNSGNPAVPVMTTYDAEEKKLTWIVTSSVTQVVGVGYAEIRAIDGSILRKSHIVPTSVENSVTGGVVVNPPSAYEDWYTQVLNSAAYVLANSQGKEVKFKIGDDNDQEGYAGHLLVMYRNSSEESWVYTDLGAVDAYTFAVEGGYTGTKAQFEADVAALANNKALAQAAAAEAEVSKNYAKTFTGAPRVATTAAGMTDEDLIYVYVGSEDGYTSGNWYYWDGEAWTSGGAYNSTALVTDKTLTVSGAAADSAKVGELKDILQSELVDATYITYASITAEGMTISGKYDKLVIYGTSTSSGVRSLQYLNGASKCLTSSATTTKNVGPGIYRVFLRSSKVLNKELRVTATKSTYASTLGSFADGGILVADENISVALRVDKSTEFGTSNDPTEVVFGLQKFGAKDFAARDSIDEILHSMDREQSGFVTDDLDGTELDGVTFTKSSDTEVTVYGTNSSGGVRVYTFLNGQKSSLTTSSTFRQTLSAGTYRINVGISGYTGYIPFVYTYNSTSNITHIERSGLYTFTAPVVIGIYAYSGKNFGTELDPTVLSIEITRLTCNPELKPSNDQTDRAPEIMDRLKQFKYCELDRGDYYISRIKMPADSMISGKGNSTRLFFIDTEEGPAIRMGARCNVNGISLFGSDDDSYDETDNSSMFAGSENKDFTGETNQWEDGDLSVPEVSGYIHKVLTNPLPAGEYYIEVDSVTSDSSDANTYMGFSTSHTTTISQSDIISSVTFPKNTTNVGKYFSLPDDVYSIRVFSGTYTAISTGHGAEWDGIHIYKVNGRSGIQWSPDIPSAENTMLTGSVTNCRFERFSCAGIIGLDTGTPVQRGLVVMNCQFRYCSVGVYFRKNSEFNQVIGCMMNRCYYGVLNRGGNNIFDGDVISGNYINIQQDDDEGSNTGHGMITSCKLHHSGYGLNDQYALIIRGTGRIVVSGCEMSDKILLKTTNGNVLSDNAMFDVDIEVNGSGCSLISNSIFRTANCHRTNNTSAVIANCYLRNGTVVTWA